MSCWKPIKQPLSWSNGKQFTRCGRWFAWGNYPLPALGPPRRRSQGCGVSDDRLPTLSTPREIGPGVDRHAVVVAEPLLGTSLVIKPTGEVVECEPIARLTGLRELILMDCILSEDAGMAFASLGGFRMPDLYCTNASDATVQAVAAIPELRWLSLTATNITDSALETVHTARRLERLSLSRTRITNAAVDLLAPDCAIRWLSVSRTSVDDGMLPALDGLPSLRTLAVNGTGVSEAGVERLARSGLRLLRH
jgi:hypothetical protein